MITLLKRNKRDTYGLDLSDSRRAESRARNRQANTGQINWRREIFRMLKDNPAGIPDFKKLTGNVQAIHVSRIGFRTNVGNKGTSGLEQLPVELRWDLMGQEAPECKIRTSKQYSNYGGEEHHHPKTKRLRFHDSGTPRR